LTQEELGAPAPDFTFTHVETQETGRLSDYRGRVVLINWWATWCAPCLEELPALNELQRKYADQGLTVLTISDESRATLVDFENDLPLETVAGYVVGDADLPDPFRRTLQIRPTSYVIDRDGIIRDFVLGAQDLPTFERMISPYIRQSLALRR
ncbi:MAG: TlpA disulfide reductase family protein, partial [Rhodothermales bacterium]